MIPPRSDGSPRTRLSDLRADPLAAGRGSAERQSCCHSAWRPISPPDDLRGDLARDRRRLGARRKRGGLDRRHLFRRLCRSGSVPGERHRPNGRPLGICGKRSARGGCQLCVRRLGVRFPGCARPAVSRRHRARGHPHARLELADGSDEPRPSGRAAGIYTSSYAAGSAASLLIAGLIDQAFGWRATFIAAGIGPVLSICSLALVPASLVDRKSGHSRPQYRALLGDRALIAYVAAYAGITWRFLRCGCGPWPISLGCWLPGNHIILPALGLVLGVGLPGRLFRSAWSWQKWRRGADAAVVISVCLASVATCVALAATAGGPIEIVLPLVILVQITSFADVGALAGGAVASRRSGTTRGPSRYMPSPDTRSAPLARSPSETRSTGLAAPRAPRAGRQPMPLSLSAPPPRRGRYGAYPNSFHHSDRLTVRPAGRRRARS